MTGIRHPRTRLTLTALLAALLAICTMTTAFLTAPAQAAGSVTIRPESLPRGAEVRGAHLASAGSKTIIDGDVKVTVRGDYVHLFGKSGTSYVVYVVRGQVSSVVRVGPGGSERVVAADAGVGGPRLASDGGLLAVTRSANATRTKIDVIKVSTGRTVLSRTFSGAKSVLDIRGSRAILASGGSGVLGTYSWNLSTGRSTLLTRRSGSAADLRTGLLATYDKDPYDGGCSILTTIAQPSKTLWRSCSERVGSFSPDGRRISTLYILSDSLGPAVVHTRSIHGYLLASYKVDGGYSAGESWESDKVLLLGAYGHDKAATVRCTGSTCVRATALADVPTY
ncbi:hypothetical protein [Nocardioides plantarum]|uniref:Uncharacterized protein n=1 Tax=Nocardioides plantarum TaxID=29299 RepID=A0ABV5K8P5_9ACTN|nr:hypothetical protein [Nocardioides plantarum]